MVILNNQYARNQQRRRGFESAMPSPFKRLLAHVCTPDAMDMIEHYQSRAERLADLWVHSVGLGLAIVGGMTLAALAAIYAGAGVAVSTAIYGICLIAMLTASTVYNLTKPSAARPILRRLDEGAIFLMIAGSYTPFTTQRFDGAWSIGFTAVVWTIALGGLFAKLVAPRISDRFWSAIYGLFGWLAVFAIEPMMRGVHPVALGLLIAGGVIYTAGIFVFVAPNLPYRRAIWHGFVVAGAGAHWAAVLLGVVLAPAIV